MLTEPFLAIKRTTANHLDHAFSLHFNDLQSCSMQIAFPACARHSTRRTNKNNIDGKCVLLGWKERVKSCVCRKIRSSIGLLGLDRHFNLSLNLSQGSHQTPSLVLRLLRIRNRSLEFGIPRYFELLARRAKYSTYSQSKLKTKTSAIFSLIVFKFISELNQTRTCWNFFSVQIFSTLQLP